MTQPKAAWLDEVDGNASTFWSGNRDRVFMTGLYPRLARFNTVLDIGAREFNLRCKGLIGSKVTRYWQLEPYPPHKLDNDGLMNCTVQQSIALYPHLAGSFDAVLDFGVLGWIRMSKADSVA